MNESLFILGALALGAFLLSRQAEAAPAAAAADGLPPWGPGPAPSEIFLREFEQANARAITGPPLEHEMIDFLESHRRLNPDPVLLEISRDG